MIDTVKMNSMAAKTTRKSSQSLYPRPIQDPQRRSGLNCWWNLRESFEITTTNSRQKGNHTTAFNTRTDTQKRTSTYIRAHTQRNTNKPHIKTTHSGQRSTADTIPTTRKTQDATQRIIHQPTKQNAQYQPLHEARFATQNT